MPPHLQCLQGRPAPTLVMLLPPAFSVADAAARGLLGEPAGREAMQLRSDAAIPLGLSCSSSSFASAWAASLLMASAMPSSSS